MNDIHLRSRTTLLAPQKPIVTKVQDPSNKNIDESNQHSSPTAKEPLFPHRFIEHGQPTENHAVIDFLNRLKQMTIKISLMDAIKEVHA